MLIKFKRDTAFRKQFFAPDSFAHPAKMDAQLLIWIVEHYTSVGEAILDPMAGSGTTMLACGLCRNVILVELEEKFCKMCRDNWEEVKMRPRLGYQMGSCEIIQGDARQLEGLVDKIVTSPPFAPSITGTRWEDWQRKDKVKIGDSDEGKYDKPDNIGNLPYGEIDKCIFSPPYAGGEQFHDIDFINREQPSPHRPQQKQNLSHLPYGRIDKIVTSPPYEEAMGQKHHSPRADKLAQEKSNPVTYTDRVDSIITSPPYEGSISNPSDKPEYSGAGGLIQPRYYAKTDDNIGNLKSQSYLEAMLQVYKSCFAVLKSGGLLILVTKNFIRNKQVVRLDEDTIRLCEQVGFSFVESHNRKLPAQSFWRVIYHQKHPEVEQILFEDILVFGKS